MRSSILFAIVILMSTVVTENLPAQTLASAPSHHRSQTDRLQAQRQVEPKSLTIEKLYMTRQVGRATWSPDGKRLPSSPT